MLVLVQDANQRHDLRRLATPVAAADEFSTVEKLSNVRINGGWVYAERPKPSEVKRWWNPLEQYYKSEHSPYLALANCGGSDDDVVRFATNYGAIGEDPQRTSQAEVVFRLAEFRHEQRCFAFLLELASALKTRKSLRGIFSKWLEEAVRRVVEGDAASQGRWQHAITNIQWAVGVSEIDAPTGPEPRPRLYESLDELEDSIKDTRQKTYEAGRLRQLKEHVGRMSESELRKAARSYLKRAIDERISRLQPCEGFNDNGDAWLYLRCDNLLDDFYWMLANDLAGRRRSVPCAHCGRFFSTNKENVAYCPDRPGCRERGRRRLDWDRNKKKYNRNRRLKYLKKKEQKQ